eukprot:2997532-Amphidinium_carterae.1
MVRLTRDIGPPSSKSGRLHSFMSAGAAVHPGISVPATVPILPTRCLQYKYRWDAYVANARCNTCGGNA